jgi:predicted membrane channel-forming protein YqfA (hemolysin III family)
MTNNTQDDAATIAMLLLFVTLGVAWFTHIITCFSTAAWGFLIAGAIFFPVGIFHGIYLWFT